MKWKSISTMAGILGIAITNVMGASVSTLNVPNEYTTIQGAINAADNGDIVNVEAGTYTEAITIDKPITLLGATHQNSKKGYVLPEQIGEYNDDIQTIIRAPDEEIANVVNITASDVTVKGVVVEALEGIIEETMGCNVINIAPDDGEYKLTGIVIGNNIIGPNKRNNDVESTETSCLKIAAEHGETVGVKVKGNKIHGNYNGNNIYITGASQNASNADYAESDMRKTIIMNNDVCDSAYTGILVSGAQTGLIIDNNNIYNNGRSATGDNTSLKYGHGIAMVRSHNDVLQGLNDDAGEVKDMTIISNEIFDNAQSGIYMGPMNSGHKIVNNSIYDNGATLHAIDNEYEYESDAGIKIDLDGQYYQDAPGAAQYSSTEDIEIHSNIIENNAGYGVQVIASKPTLVEIDATMNWWGAKDGPSGQGAGTGDAVSSNVNFSPWWGEQEFLTLDKDIMITEGSEMSVTETLTVSGSTTTVDHSKLNVGRLELEHGAILNVVDGELTLQSGYGEHTISGTFIIYNSWGTIYIESDTTYSGDELMLVSHIVVSDGVTLTVDGSLVWDGCVVESASESGAFNLNVNPGANFTMARTELENCNVTLNSGDTELQSSVLKGSNVTIGSSADGARVYHNVLLDGAAIADNGSNTVLEKDNWGNVKDTAGTVNNLALNLNAVGLIADRTLMGGNLYIQPEDEINITMDISALNDRIQGCEALMGFSTEYFDLNAGTLTPAAPWSVEIKNYRAADTGSAIYGEVDSALGLELSETNPEGSQTDAKMADINMTSKVNKEGTTVFYFREQQANDDQLIDTRLTVNTTGGAGHYMTPFTINSGYITVDGTAPSIQDFTANQAQPGIQLGENDVNVFDYSNSKTRQGTITFTVCMRDDNAGIDDNDVTLTLQHEDSTSVDITRNPIDTEIVTIDTEDWTKYTFEVTVDATYENGIWDVKVWGEDRSGNDSATLSGTLDVQKNEVSVDIELEGAAGEVFDREVEFIAADSGGNSLKSWTETVTFDGTGGHNTASLTLYESPDNIEYLSAKTGWNLLRNVQVTDDNDVGESGQTKADFTGDGVNELRGGDLNDDNLVNLLDYAKLRYFWYTTNPEADINGDGEVQTDDYTIMANNWYTTGDDAPNN